MTNNIHPEIEYDSIELVGTDAYDWLDRSWDGQKKSIKRLTDDDTAYPIQTTIISEPDEMIVEVGYVTVEW